jgi:hypothetical protein
MMFDQEHQTYYLSVALCMFPGGYYTIEQKVRKLRLIALNTNLYARRGATNGLRHPEAAAASSLPGSDDDPAGQWAWLEAVLDKSMKNRETVSDKQTKPNQRIKIF